MAATNRCLAVLAWSFWLRRSTAPDANGVSKVTVAYYLAAAFAEIFGCFAFWSWVRLGGSPLWVVPGIASLIAFAMLLTRVDAELAGRAYAAYGGVYIAASLLWLWLVEGNPPDRWDLAGAAVSLAGAGLILLGPRASGT